ncbi:protein MAIN-LIKE 2 [Cynara cardunculus var. scolymus]|uniref:protein MAIN-LIKE 2 n=1 Tax=Cynara cardunculus var. scolymus TaxID=59895 RepID=UPI000D627BA2|nr:protein MAIN-LIKE 2 [Cynara cardunculus var. scolymus]XP_024959493.1 protein MAIN-LIKE 2 [Cynara cardunculus var. scolymus]
MDFYATNPGPIDDSVLYDQEKHVSSAVWEGQERGALRCHEHTSKLDQWTLTSKQIELVNKAGFGYLRLIPAISLDNPLISALVERWRRETNTFHFTVGEMSVTLEDVGYLLGLPIDGEPVIGVTYTTCDAVCMRYLGRTPDSGSTSGGMVKLSWLKETFSRCPEDAPFDEIERHTRAYLLYLVGSTVFSTTTGNKVPVMYLPLFENFDQAGRYAWGAAALSFLYRALGNASLRSQSTISGCLTLLQCWSYFRLNIGRPRLNHDPTHDRFPFVFRWKGKHTGPTTNRDVAFYRKALDSLKPSEVEWCPYMNINCAILPEDIRDNLILGRSNTMLICFDKAERHLPDRCLRQFGLRQPIPLDVQQWERKSRGVDGGVDLSGKMETELSEWSDRHLRVVDVDEDVEESEYLHWYLKITRKLVGRPIPISSEFQRMNAALRDIANVADMVSTHGMDDQQMHAVTRIRYLAHECLRDQIGNTMIADITDSDQNEVDKKIRGKERIRRKGMGIKRRRKDDSEQFQSTSSQQQFCIPTSMDMMDHIENNEVEICLPPPDDSQLCYIPGKVDETHRISDAVNGIDDSGFCPTVEEVDDNLLSGGAVSDHGGMVSSLENGDMAQQNDYSVLV